jgi:hypothetical protein
VEISAADLTAEGLRRGLLGGPGVGGLPPREELERVCSVILNEAMKKH